MKKILEFFKNRIVISLIGLLALSILIWFAGPHIKFGEDNTAPLGSVVARLIGIIIIVVLWGLNNLRIQLQNKKQNEELVDDLQENNKDLQTDLTSGQTSEELHQLNQRFAQALATLKKLKFKGASSSKALYELPWYIIIGPPGSGKTTALVNSTLDFPLAEQFGKGALQGVGGTRNCDWWFTNDAILIDTAGRYTTQDSHRVVDSSAWEGFLNLLKKNRRRRPINGAIIAISIQDLLTQTEEQRIAHAKTIRTRIDELMEKLEIRFPIYLMFTKSDLVSGFTEFFEDLSKEEREQVWGVSLPNAPKPSQSPDFDYLNEEYEKLIKRIYDRVLWRIHTERDARRRALIQGFPQQMENLKSVIDSFVKQTFISNRYRFQPYLRGIYFSSGTQEGSPIDRLMTSVSSSFGFAREAVHMPHGQGKSYFLGKLFRNVIFPESELVGSNRKYETIILWAQRVGYVGMAVLAILTLVVWTGSITRHEMFMSEVTSYIGEFNAESKRLSPWNKDPRNVLPTLNALAKASIVYDQEEHPWLSGMGLYDGNVDDAADDAYAAQLKELFLPRIVDYLESYIKQGHRGGDLYNTFRTYLMFNKTEHMNKQLVKDWFVTNWTQNLHGEATTRKELEAHLDALLSLELEPVEINSRLVSQTRDVLLRVPVSQRIYSRIRTNPQYLHSIDILNRMGESVRSAFKIDDNVIRTLNLPLMFTIDGYEQIDLSTNSPIIADITNERWVLDDGENARVDFIKDDLDEISKKVQDHYLSDYLEHWNAIYKGLEITEFTSLKHANDVLASFTDPVYSPLIAILQVGSENTTLSSQLFANLADDYNEGKTGKATNYMANKFEGTKVDIQFRDLNVLLRETSKKPAAITAILQNIRQLQEFINEVSLSPDPDKKSFEIAKARYQSGSGNPITALHAFSNNTPQPVKRWLDSLSQEVWKIVLKSAHQHVNAEWRTRVYQPYIQGLAGRYPLRRDSKDELALFDFNEFFKPTGTMDTFYQNYTKPFIDTSSGWSNRVVDNHNIGFSSEAINQTRRALFIKNVFYSSNPAVPGITLQFRPYKMDKKDVRFMLEIGDKRISYNHGPKFWKTLKWSGDDENKRVRILFEDLNENIHSESYDGPWALFKLQDKSNLQKTRQSNVYIASYTVNEKFEEDGVAKVISHRILYEIKTESVNNPLENNLLGSFRCPESI
ncbi:MAG TPA: type VI secretion system membrane subunit TssM [Gammaproteobacteria bacterium]